jgi:hypothetical protein
MNEMQQRAAVAALQNMPRDVVAQQAVQSETRYQRIMARLKKAGENAAANTMEAVKVIGTVGAGAAAGFIEKQLPDYEYIGETGIPMVGALGAGAVLGSVFVPGEAGQVLRSVGAGMGAVAAYKLVRDAE